MTKMYIDYTEGGKDEKLEWDGSGFYATKQIGSPHNAHYSTVKIGEFDEDYELIEKRARRNGWGTPFELKKPYGELIK
jgi:hypothetical protein